MNEPTDSELMSQVRQGDVGKLGILFERHHRRLFSFFYRLSGRRETAEDLVQDVFVRMLRYRESFRDRGELTAWMFALARNVAADQLSRHRLELPEEASPGEPVDEAPPVLERLERADASARLHAALASLPLAKREVLVLSRFGQLKYEQIAGLLGVSVGAVKVRVHRALKELRAVYEGQEKEVTT